jgi:hypothetical protein
MPLVIKFNGEFYEEGSYLVPDGEDWFIPEPNLEDKYTFEEYKDWAYGESYENNIEFRDDVLIEKQKEEPWSNDADAAGYYSDTGRWIRVWMWVDPADDPNNPKNKPQLNNEDADMENKKIDMKDVDIPF